MRTTLSLISDDISEIFINQTLSYHKMHPIKTLTDLVTNNPRYIMSDAVGFGLSWGGATAAMAYLSHTSLNDGLTVLAVFGVKTLGFAAGKVLSHGSHEQELAKSSGLNALVKGSFQFTSHYALIKTGWLPEVATPVVAYVLPGLLGTVARWVQDYKSHIITTDKHTDVI